MARLKSYYLNNKDGETFYPVANWGGVDDKPDLSVYATKEDVQDAITLKSPDGSTWSLSVDNNGALSATKKVTKGTDK